MTRGQAFLAVALGSMIFGAMGMAAFLTDRPGPGLLFSVVAIISWCSFVGMTLVDAMDVRSSNRKVESDIDE